MAATTSENQPSDFPKIGAPAQRALTGAGYHHLAQLTEVSAAELLQLHGMGPKAIRILREALAAQGLAFAGEQVNAEQSANEQGTSAGKGDYAEVNGLRLYYEIHGPANSKQPPLVLLHGGLGMIEMMDSDPTAIGGVLTTLAKERQVIGVDLQGHGRTADSDRPIRYEAMGEDIAALLRHLGIAQADLMGYSLGAGTALRAAIQHPDLVRKLVVVATPFKRTGWYHEVLAGMDQIGAAAAEFMQATPIYQNYVRVAPKPENFPLLLDKMGDLLRQPYDWSNEVAGLPMAVMLVFGDADSVPISHIAEFFSLLGGSQRDASWDGSGLTKHHLAILPATTHYNIFASPLLATIVKPFLDEGA